MNLLLPTDRKKICLLRVEEAKERSYLPAVNAVEHMEYKEANYI